MIMGRARAHAFEFADANTNFIDAHVIAEMRNNRVRHAVAPGH